MPDPSQFASLPTQVRDALCAADKLLAILQKGMTPDLHDRIGETYDELGFALDQIEGMPHV